MQYHGSELIGGALMNSIRTILVTTDFSDTSKKAFGLATQVSKKFEAKLVLLYVRETHLPPLVLDYAVALPPALEAEHQEKTRKTLEKEAEQLGPDVESVVVEGTPHIEIVRLAEERELDMIVMATHGRGFFSHAILGSTTERVIRRAPCPVLVVRNAPD
jgi:nucleotide-binding universal stress UspA family protein